MFRALLTTVTVLCWLAVALVAGHRSMAPSVLGRWSPGWAGIVVATALVALVATAAHSRRWYARVRAWRFHLALLCATVVIDLALVEAALRVLDPFGLSYFQETVRYDLDKIPDPELIYHHRPGQLGTYAGVPVAINELGLRDDAVGAKSPGELRVLALGDSVTFGWGVAQAATWCEQLERLLEQRRGGPARVINTGCGGFDSAQELTLLERHGERVAPDLVVLLYVANDVEMNHPPFDPRGQLSLRGKSLPKTAMVLVQRSWIWRLGYVITRTHKEIRPPDDPRPAGWQRSLESVASMNDWCRARRVPFALFLWRARADAANDILLQDLSALGRERSFPVVDTLPWLAGVPRPELTLSAVDAHPSPHTHLLLAAGIFAALQQMGLLAP